MSQVDIQISDNFTDGNGEWPNYDTIDLPQLEQIHLQKHVDVRSFVQSDIYGPSPNMQYLGTLDMSDLASMTMDDLVSPAIVQYGEQWSAGTVGAQADRDNVNGISLSCAVGLTTTTSIITVL